MSPGDLPSLYKAHRVTLWVEDVFTREYLRAAWDSPVDIGFAVAGGHSYLKPLIADARQHYRHLRVWGLRDRDFGATNRGAWKEETEVFVPEVFEAENWLLASSHLVSCPNLNTRGLNQEALSLALHRAASSQVWWLALRYLLEKLKAFAPLPAHPSIEAVPDPGTALAFVKGSAWWASSRQQVLALDDQWLIDELQLRATALQAELADGSFVRTFPGKELLDIALKAMWQGNWPNSLRDDAGRQVGAWQRENGKVPSEVEDLRKVLIGAV